MVTYVLFIADFGGLGWHVLNTKTRQIFQLSLEQFLALDWLPPRSFLVVENAHLGVPRSDYSLAQVYTANELLFLYAAIKAKQCKLGLFPQGLTPKARAMAGITKKTDAGDLQAIAWYIQHVLKGDISSLRKPPSSFETTKRVEAGWTFQTENDGVLNVARRYKYTRPNDYVASLVGSDEFLNALADKLSDNAKSFFCLTNDERHARFSHKWKKSSARTQRLYTLMALFFHPDGYIRQRPDTKALPGMNWLKRNVLHFSPHHFKGGIARSNIMWHLFRNEAIKALGTRKLGPEGKVLSHYDYSPMQQAEFLQVRKQCMAAVTETMHTMRDIAQEKLSSGELSFKR
jgi:hypothetical protein